MKLLFPADEKDSRPSPKGAPPFMRGTAKGYIGEYYPSVHKTLNKTEQTELQIHFQTFVWETACYTRT